ncbi:MAG: GDSL-type esterase/lipase family protein, partial [Clostridia bacterium]|nr:GDSL-type esterase/lipase family protein [Clostridia bacterium]
MSEWKASWGYRALDFRLFQTLVGNETQRVMLKNNLNGERVRLHFSNRYGVESMTFDRVLIAPTYDMITAECQKGEKITFGGSESVTLEPGDEITSDEVEFSARSGIGFSVSTYMSGRCVVSCGVSSYPQPVSRVYNSLPGDFTAMDYFPVTPQVNFFRPVKDEPEVSFIYGLDRVDVLTDSDVKTIVCFGDSITHQSRWTGPFTDRIYRKLPGRVSVINCGIGGNRILHDAYALSGYGGLFGEAGVDRFEKDVFGSGVKIDLIIALHGVNDLLHPVAHYAPPDEKVTSDEIIDGLKTYARIAHSRQTPIAGVTLMPWRDFLGSWCADEDAKRLRVNDWIRSNDDYDDYIDFDLLTRDPNDTTRLLKLCDSGDNIHPGQAGG